MLEIEEVIRKTEMRFEPRTLIDLSGQVASKYRSNDLELLRPQVKKCLLAKIVRDHTFWYTDALKQDQLVQSSVAIRRLLHGTDANIPLGYEQYILVEKDKAIYELEWGVHIAQIFEPDRKRLSPTIRSVHVVLPFLMKLLYQWYQHWQNLKAMLPEERK